MILAPFETHTIKVNAGGFDRRFFEDAFDEFCVRVMDENESPLAFEVFPTVNKMWDDIGGRGAKNLLNTRDTNMITCGNVIEYCWGNRSPRKDDYYITMRVGKEPIEIPDRFEIKNLGEGILYPRAILNACRDGKQVTDIMFDYIVNPNE